MQTDSQTRARLNVEPRVANRVDSEPTGLSVDMHQGFRSQLEKWLPEAIAEEQYLVAVLENFGQSPVLSVTISVKIAVEPGTFLASKAVGEASHAWEVTRQVVIRPGEKGEIPLAPVGCFPRADFEFRILYSDGIGESPSPVTGTMCFQHTNPLAMHARL